MNLQGELRCVDVVGLRGGDAGGFVKLWIGEAVELGSGEAVMLGYEEATRLGKATACKAARL